MTTYRYLTPNELDSEGAKQKYIDNTTQAKVLCATTGKKFVAKEA